MEIQKINVDMQGLERVNKGTSFLNIEDRYTGKKYFIYALLETRQDLKEKEEKVVVQTNLPIGENSWRDTFSPDEFFKGLKVFTERPLAKIRIPLKSEISSCTLSSLKGNLRDETIRFEDINIQVGELAKKKFKKDFVLDVEKILNSQDNTSHKEIQDKVNAYINLRNKIEALKNLLCKKKESYSYSREKEDETIKLPLTAEEYNSKLQEVEKELRVLEKEFNLRETDLDYEKVKTEETYDSWFKANEEQLREDFENNQAEEESEMTFDEYVEVCFEEGSYQEE